MAWLHAAGPVRLAKRHLGFDVFLGLVLTPYLAIAAFGLHMHFSDPVIIYLIEGIAVVCRRWWPALAVMLTLAVAATSEVTQWPYPLGVGIVVYTIAALNTPRVLAWAFAITCGILLTLPAPFSHVEHSPRTLGQIVPESVLVTIAPMLAGLYTRERHRLISSLSLRASEGEQRRELEAQRIRADERNRLAGEIHDVLAHTVSLMVVHTGALTVAASDAKTRDIAEHIRAAGSAALEELRQLVGVLRKGETAPLGPVPSISNLPALFEESRATGTIVDVFESGLPTPIPGPVERTTYRLIQESLTNARKHAPRSRVTINLTWRPEKVVVSVHNDVSGAEAAAFPVSGHGLNSLRERVELLSGRLDAGPTAGGGWTVSASMPLGGPE